MVWSSQSLNTCPTPGGRPSVWLWSSAPALLQPPHTHQQCCSTCSPSVCLAPALQQTLCTVSLVTSIGKPGQGHTQLMDQEGHNDHLPIQFVTCMVPVPQSPSHMLVVDTNTKGADDHTVIVASPVLSQI
jgi:hypothetical protein